MYVFIPSPVPHCLNHCSYVVELFFSLLLLCQECFSYLGPVPFHVNFRINSILCTEMSIQFLARFFFFNSSFIKPVDKFRKNCHLCCIEFLVCEPIPILFHFR
jgi:hypothetical protein